MKVSKILIMLGMVILFTMGGQCQTVNKYIQYNQKARDALKKNDYNAALKYFKQMLLITPAHPRLHYYIARVQALLGNKKEAIQSLETALDMGFGADAQKESAFKNLHGLREFRDIIKKIVRLKKPIHTGKKAFTLKERDLVPEGITHDPVDDCFYLGSTYKCKIVKIDRKGKSIDFTAEKQDGLRTVLGMRVDARRRILWANSAVGDPPPQNVDPQENGWSGLFKYDLKTGKLIKKYTLHRKGENHLFNDLVCTGKGDVFITDSDFGAVYTVSHQTDKLELFIDRDSFIYPNGIALAPDEKTLYVAASEGIITINIKTREYARLLHPNKMSLSGIDGLYFYQNGFIAVQNGLDRIARFFLNKKTDHVERMEILESNNPLLNVPTTGVIVKDQFYYIANCAFRAFKPDGSLDREKLTDIVILKTHLGK